jgi:predicted regulator of Ras-like GTPase activity (Roadblock/LC7/MglB family)
MVAAADKALAELLEISSQIDAAVLFDQTGKVVSSTLADAAAERVTASARALLDEAERLRKDDGGVVQVEAALPEGSLFVVREGTRAVAAVTRPEPTAGLVFYDLKQSLAAAKPKRKRTATKAKASGEKA